MNSEPVNQSALAWLRRLYGLPALAQRLALAGLAVSRPAVAARVRQLLSPNATAASILDRPLHAVVPPPPAPPADVADATAGARIGRRLGAWRITGILGSGGMGTVYLASRDDATYERDVALKCIRSELPLPQLQAAFQNERNALAALNHRDIVPILDSGLDADGTPWFVMPVIEGVPVDRWCAQHRLGIRERVHLFIQICDAIAYAHKRGVLHQDIKASAVLVTAEGHPKLLDFGLAATAHRFDGASSGAGERLPAFSPTYAAPELLRGGGPTTAIDIYALGILLYRLLCGRSSISASPMDIPLSALIDRKPSPPSALALDLPAREYRQRRVRTAAALGRLLAGDLDSIALKCVACDPDQRYETVDALRDDLKRWTEKRPISLRSGIGYRAKRFVQRHMLQTVAATIVLALAVAAGVTALWQQQQALHEIELSTRVDQIFSQSLGAAALSRSGDLPMSSSQLLDRTEANFRRYASKDRPDVLARGLSILARSQADTGAYPKAESLARESRSIGHQDTLEFAFNQVTLARLFNLRAQYGGAEQESRNGLNQLRFGFGQQYRIAGIQLKMQMAIAQSGKGEERKAMGSLNAAIQEAKDLKSAAGDMALAQLLILRGSWYRQRLKLTASEQDLSQAIALADPIEPRIVDDARESLMRTIRASRRPGREARALTMAQDLLNSRRQTLGERHPQTGVAWGELAFMQMLNMDDAAAATSIERASGIVLDTVGAQHPAYARVLIARAQLATLAGQYTEAAALTSQAIDILARRYGIAHEFTLEARFLLSSQYWSLARTDPAMIEKAIDMSESTIGTYVKKYGEVAAFHRTAYATLLASVGRQWRAEREIAQARTDARHQYGENSQEMLHIRLAECSIRAIKGSDDRQVVRELDRLIEDAGRVDSLYARAILWSAYLEKTNLQKKSGDLSGARSTLLSARRAAQDANQSPWVARIDRELGLLDQAANALDVSSAPAKSDTGKRR